jgi:hypothetical protein
MAASIITLFMLLYLSVDILLLCRKHLHGRFYNNTVRAVYIWVLTYYSYVESTCMAASIITLFTLLYLSVGILLLCRKHLHGRFYNNTVRAVYIWVLTYYSYVESTCMAASIITLFTLLYLSVDILLLCRKHLHGRFYNNTVHAVISECWHITPM